MARDFEDHCWQDVIPPDEMDIYGMFRREVRGVGPKPALVAIDLYKKVYRGGPLPVPEANRKFRGSCGENAWNAIEPTERLFAAARKAGLPVIYTTGHKNADGVSATNRKPKPGESIGDGYDIKEEFAPRPGDLVVEKERASGFFATPMSVHLKTRGAKSIILCGESTSGCLRASAVEAFSLGYHVVVVEECCFDRSMLSHKIALFDLHHKYVDVMHVDEVVDALESMAAGQTMAAE